MVFVAVQVFMLFLAFRARKAPEEAEPEDLSLFFSSGLTIAGIVLVGAGGYFLVESAEELAKLWHVPPAIIGLSVVAIGTSLPELAATIAAVRQREGDLILGNIIGSNLANILIVFGLTSLLVPGKIDEAHAYTPVLALMVLATLILLVFICIRRPLGRLIGSIFLISYAAFIVGSYLFEAPHP